MTIDVEPADPDEPWPYDAEEIVDSLPGRHRGGCSRAGARSTTPPSSCTVSEAPTDRFGYILTRRRQIDGGSHPPGRFSTSHDVPFTRALQAQGVRIVGRQARRKRAAIGSRLTAARGGSRSRRWACEGHPRTACDLRRATSSARSRRPVHRRRRRDRRDQDREGTRARRLRVGPGDRCRRRCVSGACRPCNNHVAYSTYRCGGHPAAGPVHIPLPVAGRPLLQADDHGPREGARGDRRSGAVQICRGEGARRGHHDDAGLAETQPAVRGMAGPPDGLRDRGGGESRSTTASCDCAAQRIISARPIGCAPAHPGSTTSRRARIHR